MESPEAMVAFFSERVPAGWRDGELEVLADRDEVLVVVPLPGGGGEALGAARVFREETREQRMRLAREAERRFGRKVSWGVRAGGERILFTVASVPAMTRLRIGERAVLDTLIDAGVARSRSDALAWCVRLVGANEGRWLSDLREAFARVEVVRDAGPQAPGADLPPAAPDAE